MTAEPSSTRARAARTLDRILVEGAYSNIVVANDHDIDRDDHALYQRLVYEALRHLPGIDEAIERAGSREIGRIQREVLAVLRVATGEIRYLGRPHHSAVSESVDAVRELGRPKAAGFVNGVLRSIVRQRDQPLDADAHRGMPAWLYDRLEAVFGATVNEFLDASNTPARTAVRSRDGTARGEESPVAGVSYPARSTDISSLVSQGSIDVIDPASAAAVTALAPGEGDLVLDLAAAPGGKTRMIADQIGASGRVVALDNHYRRLSSARTRSHDISNISWLVADARRPPFRPASFDHILLDAPCTGLGTLRRRPEIRYRIDPDAPSRYGQIQRSMLEQAAKLLRPGGRLVYSVCTVFPEETIDVVARMGFHPPETSTATPWGDGVLFLPHVTGTDGMFIAVLDA